MSFTMISYPNKTRWLNQSGISLINTLLVVQTCGTTSKRTELKKHLVISITYRLLILCYLLFLEINVPNIIIEVLTPPITKLMSIISILNISVQWLWSLHGIYMPCPNKKFIVHKIRKLMRVDIIKVTIRFFQTSLFLERVITLIVILCK